ncbi:MAG: SH3 domain-containing protein [Lysobacterales bacterium]
MRWHQDRDSDRVPVNFALVVAPHCAPSRTRSACSRSTGRRRHRPLPEARCSGTPVAVLHASRDGRWRFVVAPNYGVDPEWRRPRRRRRARLAIGYAERQPQLVVTGSGARRCLRSARPVLSVPLDMGTHLPLLADWPPR